MQGVAVLTSVSREALAKTGGVVTLATAAALVAVVLSSDGGIDRGNKVGAIGSGLNRDTSQLRGAAIVAFVVVNNQQVLWALDVVTGEGYSHLKLEGSSVLRIRHRARSKGAGLGGHSHTINHLVGKHHKGKLNVVGKFSMIKVIRVTHHKWDSSEGLVKLGLEGHSKGLAVDIGSLHSGEVELEELDVLVQDQVLVDTSVQNIVTIGAHSLGAINIAVQGIADTSALLMSVPTVVVKGLGVSMESSGLVVVPGGLEVQVLNVLAGTVTRAVIGAGSSLAALALIAIKASTFTSVTLADTTTRALQVLVEVTIEIRSINPGNLIGTHSLRAISTVVRKTHTPVVVAHTHIINGASTVTRAMVVTGRVHGSKEGRNNSNRKEHINFVC